MKRRGVKKRKGELTEASQRKKADYQTSQDPQKSDKKSDKKGTKQSDTEGTKQRTDLFKESHYKHKCHKNIIQTPNR